MRRLAVLLLLILHYGYTQVTEDCTDQQFECANKKKCIPYDWKCDGAADCRDQSDEDPEICEQKSCTSGQFTCMLGGMCIPQKWRCDKQEDCPDGSDENNCITTKLTTKPMTKGTTETPTQVMTEPTTPSTTKPTMKPTTQATTRPTTIGTTKITIKAQTGSSRGPSTQGISNPGTEPTTQGTTKPSTEPTTQGKISTTNLKPMTEGTIRPSTELTPKGTTRPTTKPTTEGTTIPSTKLMTKGTIRPTIKPTTKETTTTLDQGLTVEITPGDTEIRRRAGSTVELECTVHGLPADIIPHVTWYANGNEVSDHSRVFVRSTNSHTKKLYMFDISDTDKGTYWCEASNGGDIVRRTVSIAVFKDIKFENTPSTQYPWSGTDALIQCEASGDRVSTVWWRRYGKVIKSGGRYVYEAAGLRIYKITRADTGLYMCVAEVAAEGRVKETLISVVVR